MLLRYILLLWVPGLSLMAAAQDIPVPSPAVAAYPRFFAGNGGKQGVQQLIAAQAWARNAVEKAKESIAPYLHYCETDSLWMAARLQMYWKSKSGRIFIRGGVYDHAGGTAPAPTVRFPGARDNVTIYAAPRLEDIPPFMDDPRGIYLVNRSRPGEPMEWAEISKTGRIIENINTRIMQLANTAARLYWIEGKAPYAAFAFTLFDMYMTGMYYREPPVDITHGHHQTIAGLSTFEVIQEVAMLNQLTGIYDCLHDYLVQRAPEKMKLYADVFRKWADVQATHGVAFNNWDLMQARNILNIALVLDDNSAYANGRGNRYYTNLVLNTSAERHWSLVKLLEQGYDPVSGLWYESPGYSMVVLGDFTHFISFFDNYYHLDLLSYMPILKKAVPAMAQYLFPNGFTSSFGDAHYSRISTDAAMRLLANARMHHKPEEEALVSRYIKTIDSFNRRTAGPLPAADPLHDLDALLLPGTHMQAAEPVPAGNITDYASPVCFAPNVSYFALRNGFDPKNGLMAAFSGSKGNHMHAGGISMELYGKGLVLAPESGIGTSYFQPDYAEYYSQFPAHNTVAVDGISAYPVMKSNHGFELLGSYPLPGVTQNYFPLVCFGNLYFLEPETQSDQNRITSIIRTGDSTGYYIDIFRSGRKDGRDKMHDYFYHNMGQSLSIANSKGISLPLQPTDKLSFAGGHLFAYDYFYDKSSIITSSDINAVFRLQMAGQPDVQMHLWLKGEPGREIFSVKAPPSKAIDRMGLPAAIADLPLPTLIARQYGEARTKPFAAVYEPGAGSTTGAVQSIAAFAAQTADSGFTGIRVENACGTVQYIFCGSAANSSAALAGRYFSGSYGVISENKDSLEYLFLGQGTEIAKAGYAIRSLGPGANAVLWHKGQEWFFSASTAVTLSLPAAMLKGKTRLRLSIHGKQVTITGSPSTWRKIPVKTFNLPATAYTGIAWQGEGLKP